MPNGLKWFTFDDPYSKLLMLGLRLNGTEDAPRMKAEQILGGVEHRAWVERNDKALRQHGEEIRKNGLAGAEFNRL